MLEGLATKTLNIGVVIAVGLVFLVILVAIVLFIRQRRKWDVMIIYLNKDNTTGGFDKGCFDVDKKTNNKLFYVKRANVGLCPDNVPIKLIGNKRVVFLARYGLKNFRFINWNMKDLDLKAQCTEEDVNWALQAYEKQKHVFQSKGLAEYLPYIALVIVAVVILIMIIYVLNKLDVMKDVAAHLDNAAQVLSENNKGTVIK